MQKRRKNRIVPFGYEVLEGSDGVDIKPIREQLEALFKAEEYIKSGAFTYRSAAEWLEAETGRSISHVGLRTRIKDLDPHILEEIE